MEKTGRTRKILVVGSDPSLGDATKKALDSSYDVTFVSNNREALEKARREMPDAILLGYLEPRGSAFELHRTLRRGWITRHIPLLVVDVESDQSATMGWRREEGLQMDADDYVILTGRDDSNTISGLLEPIGLKEKLDASWKERSNILEGAVLDPDTFSVTWEQIAGRGAFEIEQEELIDNVAKAAKSGIIHGISVTDNPGGNPAISTEMLCAEIKRLGVEPLVHLACRDKNRTQMESMLYGLAAAGVRNLLVLTGDYPSNAGLNGRPKPVFDLDPVHVLQLVETMNRGLEHQVMRKKKTLVPTDFFAGVAVSPFKKLESELMDQYYKLGKKIRAGAKFIITQVGYDARKLHELLQWLRLNRHDIPVIANIYVLSHGVARIMNANQVPGCVVTDKHVAELAEEAKAADKGRSGRMLKAAKMYAITKGMGFAGVHIGGHGMTYEMVEYVVHKGEELAKNWQDLVAEFDYPQAEGFYFFEKDPTTHLNLEKPVQRPSIRLVSPMYRFCTLAHNVLFEPRNRLFKMLRSGAQLIDSSPVMKRAFGYFEHLGKVALFGCTNCGDCALFDVAYLCPMSQCPKSQRNGPCGGSYEGWCEVYPNERRCVWVKAYERLKSSGKEDMIGEHIVPPCNWDLWETSSWLNFYLGRDHIAKRLGISPPQAKPSKERPAVAKEAKMGKVRAWWKVFGRTPSKEAANPSRDGQARRQEDVTS